MESYTELLMQDFEKLGAFYLGREYDHEARATTDGLLLYDSKDLVTHAVCVGMTGSGKTGLCLGLLEEAAIDGIPSIIIDPKGDLGNLLLQFPDLRAEDFAPWVNEDDARREGMDGATYAQSQAELWSKGLAKWGQSGDRIRKLQSACEVAIYTPGSTAGLPVSILKSLAAPAGAAAEDRELVADRVQSAATAVLSLAGIHDIDPLSSREHILLSNLLQASWNEGQDVTLEALIHGIQQPPFARIGVVDVDSFFPSKDRFALAMRLNNLLASPSFAAWMEGEALDIQRILYTSRGKPRAAIFSIAHLNDSERMFFVTLLLNEILSWTRAQAGTTSLRAIVYMDEIFGYFPPSANPPSKKPLLTLLKQARAFGVGIVLATQNPVDLDYKGLANCGTWFIGRLQTERDKERLLAGLEGAAGSGGATFDRGRMEQILAGLGKRVFLMNNVHDSAPTSFETRWCLSYLRGPLTRNQIKLLMDSRRGQALEAPSSAAPKMLVKNAESVRPVVPAEIAQGFIALRGDAEGVVYQPSLLAAVNIRFVDTKLQVDQVAERFYLTPVKDDNMPVQWPEEATVVEVHPEDLGDAPQQGVSFGVLSAAATKPRSYAGWSKDLVNWVFGNEKLEYYRVTALKLQGSPEESEAEFKARLQQVLREQRDQQLEALKAKYQPKLFALQERLRRAEAQRKKEEEEAKQEKWGLAMSVGSSILGAVLGRKALSQANMGRAASVGRAYGRMQKNASDVERAGETVEAVQQMIADLDAQFQADSSALAAKFDPLSLTVETACIKPKKVNIQVRYLGLVWAPYRGEEAAW